MKYEKINSSFGNVVFNKSKTKSYFESSSTLPGPGKYTTNIKDNEGMKSVKIGKQPRTSDWEEKKPHLYPGPGNYSNHQTSLNKNGPKFQTTKRITINLDNTMKECGPGKYDPKTQTIGNGTKFSFQSKLNYEKKSVSPGPCAYKIDSNHNAFSATKYKFTTSKRSDIFENNSISPGPANYNIKEKKNSIIHGFGREKRIIYITPKTPGPGQYQVNEHIVGKLPSYLIPHKGKNLVKIKNKKLSNN